MDLSNLSLDEWEAIAYAIGWVDETRVNDHLISMGRTPIRVNDLYQKIMASNYVE